MARVNPKPDKPELNIDPPAAERLKICGIASLCLFYLNRSFDPVVRLCRQTLRSSKGGSRRVELHKYSIWL